MSPELIGIVLAALLSLAAAIYTARSARQSSQATTAAEDSAAHREFQVAFLQTLSTELEKANRLNSELRLRLQSAEDTVDLERARRRDVESKLEQLTETVERLQAILHLAPSVIDVPEIQRFLATDF